MDFEGEGRPVIPQPSDKNWSNIISFDGLRLWSLGNANANLGIFYNVANNGVLKPQFVSEIKEWNKTIVKMKRSH
jgi:cell division protein FtsI (penicillin-binding protein 3)